MKGTNSSRSRDTGNDSRQRSKNPTRNDHGSKAKACKFCGTTHVARNCPAYGRSCNKCGMRNHFARFRNNFVKAKQTQTKTPVHTVKPDSNNYAYYGNMFVYTVPNSRNRMARCSRHQWSRFESQDCNLMSKQGYNILNARQPTGIRLYKTKLESYGGPRLTVQGKASFKAEYKRKYYPVDFFIVRGNAPTILGLTEQCSTGVNFQNRRSDHRR